MKKKNTRNLIIIILTLLIVTILIFPKKIVDTSKEIAECIGENSILYTQLGCTACKTQENLFGENYEYLEIIDCYYNPELCGEIKGTPTWIISNQEYLGVQTIDKLKELTGC